MTLEIAAAQTLLVGIGNVLPTDDGVGVRGRTLSHAAQSFIDMTRLPS